MSKPISTCIILKQPIKTKNARFLFFFNNLTSIFGCPISGFLRSLFGIRSVPLRYLFGTDRRNTEGLPKLARSNLEGNPNETPISPVCLILKKQFAVKVYMSHTDVGHIHHC